METFLFLSLIVTAFNLAAWAFFFRKFFGPMSFIRHQSIEPTASNEQIRASSKIRVAENSVKKALDWLAVSIDQLDLANSGFYITLSFDQGKPQYNGYSPENYLYGFSLELRTMKRYLEDRAAERAEFKPPSKQWLSKFKK